MWSLQLIPTNTRSLDPFSPSLKIFTEKSSSSTNPSSSCIILVLIFPSSTSSHPHVPFPLYYACSNHFHLPPPNTSAPSEHSTCQHRMLGASSCLGPSMAL